MLTTLERNRLEAENAKLRTENERLQALIDSESRRAEDAHGMTLRQSLKIERLRRSAGVELSEENNALIEKNRRLQAALAWVLGEGPERGWRVVRRW